MNLNKYPLIIGLFFITNFCIAQAEPIRWNNIGDNAFFNGIGFSSPATTLKKINDSNGERDKLIPFIGTWFIVTKKLDAYFGKARELRGYVFNAYFIQVDSAPTGSTFALMNLTLTSHMHCIIRANTQRTVSLFTRLPVKWG